MLCLTSYANGAHAVDNTSSLAFKNLLKQYFPLSPKQIKAFKQASSSQQKANSEPAYTPPQATSQNIIATLKPGSDQPVLRIGTGMVSSIVFTDANGQVWPIISYTLGDSKSFNVSWNKKSGVLMVQGMRQYGTSNIAVMLQGMRVPVMLSGILGTEKNGITLNYIQSGSPT
jgi:Protein of unknown function (DUF3625).